jgi:FkbM family methyltransferase
MALVDYLPADPDSRIARELARACRRYLHRFNGYSYDFVEGGEKNLMQRLAPLSFQTIFDVGANTGEWAMLAQTYFPKAVFHTFEISENTFPILTKKLSGPCFRNNNFGLSSKIGQVSYKDYGPASGLNTLIQKTSVFDASTRPETRLAEVKTGDRYCEDCCIAFIDWLKVDVEGAEHLVFSGFENFFKKKAVRVVQFEYGFNNGDAGFLMRDFFDLFSDYGYLLAKVRRRRIEFTGFHHTMNNFESGPNYVAIRQDDQAVLKTLTQ